MTKSRKYGRMKLNVNKKHEGALNLETLKSFKPQIEEIAKLCGVDDVRLFGSVASGKNTPTSDIDFLVHVGDNVGFAFGGLKWRLEELLSCSVDIVPDSTLHPLIRESVLKSAHPL